MVKSGIKIKSLTLKSIKCFDHVELNCTRDDSSVYQWTVLLGNNNTGKTSLLKAIANLQPVVYQKSSGTGNKISMNDSEEKAMFKCVQLAAMGPLFIILDG